MSATPQEIRGFFDEAEHLAAQSRAIREAFAAMRERALKKQIDWVQLKALAVAHDGDKHDEKNSRRVAKLIANAEYANWYADILHLGKDEQASLTCSSASHPKAIPIDAGATESPRHVVEPAPLPRPPAIPGVGSPFAEGKPKEPAGLMGLYPSGEIEPSVRMAWAAGSPFSDPDPRDDIRNQPFYRGAVS